MRRSKLETAEYDRMKIYPGALGRQVKFDAVIPTGGGAYAVVGNGDRYVLAPGVGFSEGKITSARSDSPIMVEIELLGKGKGYKAKPMLPGKNSPSDTNSISLTPRDTQQLQLYGGHFIKAT